MENIKLLMILYNVWILIVGVYSCLLITSCSNSNTNRPQEPNKPYLYCEESVFYENLDAGITLAGTFTYPKKKGKFPAVFLITGSGPQDRDGTTAGHRPFLVLADYLTRHGIAVLRSDDRGVGKSGGTYGFLTTTTNKDLSSDVIAAFEYLRAREEINSKKIGLIGHSGGGLVGPMVADELHEIAFLIILAGAGLNGCETLYHQVNLIGGYSGINEKAINTYQTIIKLTMEILKNTPNNENARLKLINMYKQYSSAISESDRKALEGIGYGLPKDPNVWGDLFVMPALYESFTVEPISIIKRVKCPVLALYGEKDVQVPPDKHISAIETALREGGNQDYTIKIFPGLNHLFQKCRTGSPKEYEGIEETISPIVLKVITTWIDDHVM